MLRLRAGVAGARRFRLAAALLRSAEPGAPSTPEFLSECIQFAAFGFGRRRRGAEQVPDELHRAGHGRPRLGHSGAQHPAGFLGQFGGVLEIPRQDIMRGMIRGDHELVQELQGSPDSPSRMSSMMICVKTMRVRSLPVPASSTSTSTPWRTIRAMSSRFT